MSVLLRQKVLAIGDVHAHHTAFVQDECRLHGFLRGGNGYSPLAGWHLPRMTVTALVTTAVAQDFKTVAVTSGAFLTASR